MYWNNHFELVDTCYQTKVSFDCQSQNMCEIKNDDMTKEPTNKNNELHNKWKRFTWTFQLENNLLEIQKQHPEWMPQEIALAFITKFPMLRSNILEIKWHLKHINCLKKNNLRKVIKYFQMKMEKNQILPFPMKKPSTKDQRYQNTICYQNFALRKIVF